MATTIPEWIDNEAWAGFVAMRKKIKAPLTDRAEKMLMKRLQALKDSGEDPNACLEQSEFNCWRDVYAVKRLSEQHGTQQPQTYRERDFAAKVAQVDRWMGRGDVDVIDMVGHNGTSIEMD